MSGAPPSPRFHRVTSRGPASRACPRRLFDARRAGCRGGRRGARPDGVSMMQPPAAHLLVGHQPQVATPVARRRPAAGARARARARPPGCTRSVTSPRPRLGRGRAPDWRCPRSGWGAAPGRDPRSARPSSAPAGWRRPCSPARTCAASACAHHQLGHLRQRRLRPSSRPRCVALSGAPPRRRRRGLAGACPPRRRPRPAPSSACWRARQHLAGHDVAPSLQQPAHGRLPLSRRVSTPTFGQQPPGQPRAAGAWPAPAGPRRARRAPAGPATRSPMPSSRASPRWPGGVTGGGLHVQLAVAAGGAVGVSAASRRPRRAGLPAARRPRPHLGRRAPGRPRRPAPARPAAALSSRSRAESSSQQRRRHRPGRDVRQLRSGANTRRRSSVAISGGIDSAGGADPSRLALAQQLARGLAQRRRRSRPPGSAPDRSARAPASACSQPRWHSSTPPETAPPRSRASCPSFVAFRSRGSPRQHLQRGPAALGHLRDQLGRRLGRPRPSRTAPSTKPVVTRRA